MLNSKGLDVLKGCCLAQIPLCGKGESILGVQGFLWWPESLPVGICLLVFIGHMWRKPQRKIAFGKLCSVCCLLPCSPSLLYGWPYSMWCINQATRLLIFTSRVVFPSVSVESWGLPCVVSLAEALPKWRCEFLNQACSDKSSQCIHCTFSNCLSFGKRASGLQVLGMAKIISGCPSHIWWSYKKTWSLYGFAYRRFSKLKFLEARNLHLNHAT